MDKRTIGPFRLEEELGKGGMGVVYRATYTKTGQQVALKVLPESMSSNEKLVARFEREMSILKKLNHRHIVPYYGGWKYKGQHFYAMKLMTGGSVERILKHKKRLPWKQVIDYGMQICRALDYAHRRGVIHRDLKPANLFLTEDGRLCLGDFGIARDMDATALTAAGFTVGTYAYMAPEQITGKQPITHKTDLYALGCVLFEMLTGRTPYHGESQAEMLFQHVQGEIPRISEFVDDCPEPLEELVRQLLEKDPDKRPHDAAFVLYRLNEVKNQIESAIRADTDHKAVKTIEDVHPELTKIIDQKKASQKKKKKKRRKRKEGPFYEQTWFLASCLVLLIGVITWSLWPPGEKELFLEAQKLMETDDPVQWQEAKERYLEPLLERYPDGEYAQRAREYLDKIAMHLAKRRAITDARLGREPKTEAERHFIDAWRFEQFGDRVTAIEKYRSLIELFKDRPEDRAYVALARQQIASIEAAGDQEDNRVEIINQALERADKLFEEGKVLEARKIWNSIITLYASNLEFEPQVKRARARLSGRDEETAEKSPVPGKEAAPEAQKEPR